MGVIIHTKKKNNFVVLSLFPLQNTNYIDGFLITVPALDFGQSVF